LMDTPLGEIHCHSSIAVAEGANATIVVRPESISLQKVRNGSRNSFSGKVLERFYLGNLAGYRVGCGDGITVQVQEDPWHECVVGDQVWCSFPSAQAWIVQR